MIRELYRRQKAGTFGKKPVDGFPQGFETWDAKRKVKYLIASLDEVDAQQHFQPGHVPLLLDHRVKALVELGPGAVPDLIEAVEFDKRLTRSVHFNRSHHKYRVVLGVRDAALVAASSILDTPVIEVGFSVDDIVNRDEDEAEKIVKALQTAWANSRSDY
jgi:hypothetical protein